MSRSHCRVWVPMDLKRRLISEALGTAGLLVAVVGSGIAVAGEESDSVALWIHSWVVGAALIALIAGLGRWSTHFNPAVTIALWAHGAVPAREVFPLTLAQVVGGAVGVGVADAMFGEAVFASGSIERGGAGLWLGEVVATFGLVLLILGAGDRKSQMPFLVGLYVAGAILFTSSGAFANPAVSIARACTDTWSSIRPVDVPPFVGAELIGAVGAAALARWLMSADAVRSDS